MKLFRTTAVFVQILDVRVMRQGRAMPRFYFDLVDARTSADEQDDAQLCQNEEEAQILARKIASRLAASEPDFLNGYCVLVSNSNGVEIYRAPLTKPRVKPSL